MAHHMCMACRIRSQTVGRPGGQTDRSCPECGQPLQPVTDLTAIVGFRSLSVSELASGDSQDGGAAQSAAVALPPPSLYL